MFYTYIIHSEKINRYYIDYSSNPEKRVAERHNQGSVKSTKPGRPYQLLAKKFFNTEREAKAEELRLKKAKNRNYLEWLMEGNW